MKPKLTLFEKVVLFICVLVIGTLLGCSVFQDALSPAYINSEAIEYVKDMNIPCKVPMLWWTSIADAERLKRLLVYSHDTRQIVFERMKLDDNSWYAMLNEQHSINLEKARQVQTQIFSSNGIIGLSAVSGLSMTVGWLGLSRPSDKRQNGQPNSQNNNSVKV